LDGASFPLNGVGEHQDWFGGSDGLPLSQTLDIGGTSLLACNSGYGKAVD
jgi:hypothetical protein